MRNQIHTAVDLLNAAAKSLDNKDTDMLYDLIEVVEDWMINEDEASAYKNILESMIEATGQMIE